LIWVNPSTRTLSGIGAQGEVFIFLSNITDVYAIEVYLSFNEADDIVTVVDANTTTTGVQVLPGNCPQPQVVQENLVELTTYTTEYVVTQTGATAPCNDGGVVMTIKFECLAIGTTNLTMDDVLVLDRESNILDITAQDGSIVCQP
jgi:hypothetical protein